MNEPVRILHVLQRMEAAGVQTLLMNMYRKIDRSKVQFDFLVHYKTPQFFDEEIERLGGKIYRLSVREDYNFIKYYSELQRFFKQHTEYKVVHGHMHSLGVFYLHVAKKNGVPIRIAHSHTNSTQNDSKKIVKSIMNRFYSRYATHLFACSQMAGRYMFREKDFVVINNAIISEKFVFSTESRKSKREELNIEDKFVVGCVGRFELQKNQRFAVEVFEQVRKRKSNAVLLMIGTGSMLSDIKKIVSQKGLENDVLFLGNRRDVANLYHAMDIFLMPSLFEGLGIVGVEAQAAGTPVVCTDTLPKEIDVSPLLARVSLNESPEVWAMKVIEAAGSTLAHSDTKEYIVKADYDMTELADKMQTFYLAGCME